MTSELHKRVSIHNLPSVSRDHNLGFKKLIVAGNLGTCMGVNRSLVTAQIVLDMIDGREPVFADHPLVHNNLVMNYFQDKGLIIESDLRKIPFHAIILRPAHGSTPESVEIVKERKLLSIDTTCQLVTRVQEHAVQAEDDDEVVVYRGTKNHREAESVLARLKNPVYISTPEEALTIDIPEGKNVVFFSQTTLSKYETAQELTILKKRLGDRLRIPKSSICYAATNRQDAVDRLLDEGIELLTVVGSHTSHNTRELYMKGVKAGIPSVWVENADDMDEDWFTEEIASVGITSGASVVADFTNGVIRWYEDRGADKVSLPPVKPEHAGSFPLPRDDLMLVQERYPKRKDGSIVTIPKPQDAVFQLQFSGSSPS